MILCQVIGFDPKLKLFYFLSIFISDMEGLGSITENDNPEIKELTLKLSHLNVEVKETLNNKPKPSLKYQDIVKIYKKEISSLKDLLEFEGSLKEKLKEEDNRLLKYIKEENQILICLEDYLETKKDAVNTLNDCVTDERKELYFKLEVLLRKLIRLIKKFTRRYFPPPLVHDTNDLFLSGSYSDGERNKQKSLLDILNELIVELGPKNYSETKTGLLKIDETIPHEYVDILTCADVVAFDVEDPSKAKLKLSSSN